MIAEILLNAAAEHGARRAIQHRDRETSYRDTADRVARLAAVLGDHAGPGERVAILAPNAPLYLEAYFAAAHAGLVLIPLNTRLRPPALARLLEHGSARVLLVHPACAALAAEVAAAAPVTQLSAAQLEAKLSLRSPRRPVPADAATPAHLYYTSGTTGDPKGVVLTHGNVVHHATMARRALGLGPDDVFGHIAPMFHLADAWAVFSLTQAGGCHRFCERFEPASVLDQLAGGVTLTNLVPTMLGDLVRHPAAARAYSGLRRILSGGAPIAPALVRQIMDTFGCCYAQTYGLTETSPFLTMSLLPEHLQRLSAEEQLRYRCKTGRPLEGVEVRVVDAAGQDVPPDGQSVGEIVCRGPTVTPGYFENPAATAAAFRDGWFHTGDLAVVDAEGFLDIVDRKKDVILTGGETVYSTEVEKVIAAHPAVAEVAVIGLPHPRWGEAVVACVVLRAGVAPDEAELDRHARGQLADYQTPRAFVIRDALPRTGSGKLEKRALRDEYARRFLDG